MRLAARIGLRFALHQLLFGHGQSQGRQDLVGLLFIARQFNRDVRGAAGHRGLNALLKLAMPQLHQRLIVEPQPGNAALFGRAHQRGGRGSEGAALREANELIARLLPVPVRGNGPLRADRGGQQRTQQPKPKIAGRDPFIALRVFIHDCIKARRPCAARLAEGDFLAGDILQLDGDMLEHMPEPGTLILAHPAKKAAGFAVGTAMLREARQRFAKRVDKFLAQATGGPGLQSPQIQLQANDRKARIQRGTHIDGTIEDSHACSLSLGFLLFGGREPAGRRHPGVQVEGRPGHQNMQPQPEHANRLALADFADGGEADLGGIDNGDPAAALDFNRFVRTDERSRVLIEADADGERIVGKRGDEPVLSDRVGENADR